MHKLTVVTTISILTMAFAGAANAHTRCDGDFQDINGSWEPTRRCERMEAQHVAAAEHTHIAHHTVRRSDETPDEFCRWHNGQIETDEYCSSYND